MISDYKSKFAEDLSRMIELKVAFGYSENTYKGYAKSFDKFCCEYYPEETEVTEGLVKSWIKTSFEDGKVVHGRLAFIRTFAQYMESIGKTAYLITEKFADGHILLIPYLMDENEIKAFFHQVDKYKSETDPFFSIICSVYFRLVYTCGLRPQEGRLIKRSDVDGDNDEIRIINSKQHKSRIVVMSNEMTQLMRTYLTLRDVKYPESEYLFPNPDGGPYTAARMQGRMKRFFALSKPDIPKEMLPSIRVYDLRHLFATTVLNRWIDNKQDISSRLPYLRTYMGHREIDATAYYIHLIPKHLTQTTAIDWESLNQILPRAEIWQE